MSKEAYKGQERRRKQRTKLITFCMAHFEYKGSRHEAMMVDLTDLGAGFRQEKHDGCQFKNGEVIAFTIKTPYGDGLCKASVVWSKRAGMSYAWGCQFVELSNDERDPLRCLMDSPF
jgi:hypothetical protein